MELHSSEEESETQSTSSGSQRGSRESSVTTDSGIERSPSILQESQHEGEEISLISSDSSDSILFKDSHDELCPQPLQLRRKRFRKNFKLDPPRIHHTRSMDPVKKFDKPQVVAFVSISDAED
jgi:hypothetical protein